MRIALVAFTLVAFAFIYLEVQFAGGFRIKLPKMRLPKPPRIRVDKVKIPRVHMSKVKVPKVELTNVHLPKPGSVGSAVVHGAALTGNAVGQLGSTGAAIAGTVLNNQNQ
uniref:Uncharacterized protein n=1 Tax=Rhipicephalus zambeziensis TaxID=60191 RepID=A0A224YE38_9ACAR